MKTWFGLTSVMTLLLSCGGASHGVSSDGAASVDAGNDPAGGESSSGGASGSSGEASGSSGGASSSSDGATGNSGGAGGNSGGAGGGMGTDSGRSGQGGAAGRADAGASGGNGGRGDSGATVGAGGAGVCGFRYCEGFESYEGGVNNADVLGDWKATVIGATMTVDASKPFKGARSLHITAPMCTGCTARANLHQDAGKGVPIPGNNMYGRLMVFFADPALGGSHFNIFSLTGKSLTKGNVLLHWGGTGINKPTSVIHFNYHWTGMEQSVRSNTSWTSGQWHCIQWHLDGTDTGGGVLRNQAQLSIDGNQILTVAATAGLEWANPWTAMTLGFEHFQSQNANVEVWMDDFALNGDTVVPCP